MDYCMWNSLSEKVYGDRMGKFTEEELKTKIEESYVKVTLEDIYSCNSSFRKRLGAVFGENRGPFDPSVQVDQTWAFYDPLFNLTGHCKVN